MKFVKSKRKFIIYYFIVNVALVMLLFMTFSAFPNHDIARVKTDRAYIPELHTKIELQPDGMTVITEVMKIRGVKDGVFTYTHLLQAGEKVDVSSVKLIDSSATLKTEYSDNQDTSLLKMQITSAFVGEETVSVQYKVNGLMKYLRDGQLFLLTPWTSKDVDVIDAKFTVVLPKEMTPTTKSHMLGAIDYQGTTDKRTLTMNVSARNHLNTPYELRIWDTIPIVNETSTLQKSQFRSTSDVTADIENQVKQSKTELQKYVMFQNLLKTLYISTSAIATIIFGILLLTNFIETQSIKKYLRFEKAPNSIGPGSAGKIVQELGFGLDTAIRAGVLYMTLKGLVRCQKDRLSIQLFKQKDTDFDEIDEITALQKFLFADKPAILLQKEVKDLEMTSRKTLHFFNYRKIIESETSAYHSDKLKHMHKKESVFRYMKTELILSAMIVIELILFLILQFSESQKTYMGYSILEVIIVLFGIAIISIIPVMYYISQKAAMSENNFDKFSEWQYFKTFLFNKKLVQSQLQESDDQWREFLMYATIFGADNVVLSAMKQACPEHYETVVSGCGKMILDTPESYFSYNVK